MIQFLVSTIFLEFMIWILGFTFSILITASPIISIPFYGSSGFQIIPEFIKISFVGQEKIDLLNSLFNIRKSGPDLIFHTPGLSFFQSVALGTGFLLPFVLEDQYPF